jgi:hypothetical protein
MNLGCTLKWSSKRSSRTLSHRHIRRSIELEEAKRILGAVMHVSISANTSDGEKLQLWRYNGTSDR